MTSCHPRPARIARATATTIALACLGVALGACEARLALGAPCVLASDCPTPLSCLAGRCRSACRDFRDCAYPMECVALGAETFGCRVGEDATCRGAADCTPPLACIDGACQQPCSAATECAPGLVCDPDRCAQPPPTTIVTGACDPTAAVSGCASGSRCALAGTEFACVAGAASVSDVGAPCTGQTCAEGMVCVGGRCVLVCREAEVGCMDSACEGTSCGEYLYCDHDAIGLADGSLPPALPDGLGYCSELCDVYGSEATDGCPDGTACGINIPRFEHVYWCRPLSPRLALYDDCSMDFGGCPFGTACEVDGGAPARTCRPFCHPGTGATECDIAGHTGHECVTLPELGIGVCGDI